MAVKLSKAEKQMLGMIPRPARPRKQGSGYVSCACRDCMEIAISGGKKPAFCSGCKDSGCGTTGECQRPDAYGG